jgi:two-component system phosphate regulon sensor histidine kinase PhoR
VVSAAAGAVAARLFAGARPARDAAEATGPRGGTRARQDDAAAGAQGEIAAGALLDAIMESVREGLVVVDGESRVTALNAAARELFGVREQFGARGRWGAPGARGEGRRLSDLTRDPTVVAAFREATERGVQREIKVEVETAGRGRRTFDLRVAPLRRQPAGGARARGAVGVFFDITRLERLERVRQEFLSNVSHELRTPLTAIRTFVETLEGGALDDPAHNRRFLSIIERNAARMHSLIDDILELSGIEAGTVAVEPGPVALRELVQDVLTAVGGRAQERGVTLSNEVAPDAVVTADARRLEQMLTNLVDNAVKFNREGGRVFVGHERGAGRDRVTVSDTGEGIAPEHLPRIFERFYRVDRARSRAMGGTGLGLAIVKHLARAHGGEATVRSAPGKGSVFAVELPRAEGTRDEG